MHVMKVMSVIVTSGNISNAGNVSNINVIELEGDCNEGIIIMSVTKVMSVR